MVELPISDHEAALVQSALGYFAEEVLPHSVPRIELYKLIKYIQETLDLRFVRDTHQQSLGDSLEKFERLPFRPMQLMERALWCAISLSSCEEEMDSEYAGGFSRDAQGFCSIDLRLRDVLGPRCFEPLLQNKRA